MPEGAISRFSMLMTPTIASQRMASLTFRGSAGQNLPDRDRQNRHAAAANPEWFDVVFLNPAMEQPFSSFLGNRAYQDVTRETPPPFLRAENRQSRAHGLEHFDPFVDRALVEFMFSFPDTLKIRDGVTKYLLRKATAGLLPNSTRVRVKKTGWNAPAHLWFSGGRGLDELSDVVSSASFRNRGLYDLTEANRIAAEHRQIVSGNLANDNHMMSMWQLLNLESWLSWAEQGLKT